MSKFIAEMAKNDVVRCAVEWYEAHTGYSAYMSDPPTDETYKAQVRYITAALALEDAVKRWKEAQGNG